MATPKFDRVSVEISNRVGDPVATAGLSGKWLTATARNAYLNKALFIYFNQNWEAAQKLYEANPRVSVIQHFANILPELVRSTASAVSLTSGNYTIATPNLDFYKLIGASVGSTILIRVLDESMYISIKTGKNAIIKPTAKKPVAIGFNNTIYFFPEGSTFTPDLLFVTQPLNPTDGSFLTQGGTYDSPFTDQHNSRIAEIAEKLIRVSTQKES